MLEDFANGIVWGSVGFSILYLLYAVYDYLAAPVRAPEGLYGALAISVGVTVCGFAIRYMLTGIRPGDD